VLQPLYKSGPLAAIICAVALTACGHSPTVQFYSLHPAVANATGAPLDLALAIGPAQFPRALARSQIVTRAGGSRVNVDEYHVWSAPLEYEFLRVLGDNIASDIQSDRIAVYPKEAAFKVDYRVTLDVLQFDGVAGNSVTLRARWAIAPATGDAIAVGSFAQTEPAHAVTEADNYDALVSAHSALIGDLGRLITAKLRELFNHREGDNPGAGANSVIAGTAPRLATFGTKKMMCASRSQSDDIISDSGNSLHLVNY